MCDTLNILSLRNLTMQYCDTKFFFSVNMLTAKESLLTLPESQIDYNTYTDLKDKYDALRQHFGIVELEKQEYEKEIRKLRGQQRDLIDEYEHKRSESREYEQMSAPLSASLNMIKSELETSNTMRGMALDKNIEYELLIDSLEKQRTELHDENIQYVEAVETLRSNVNRTELDYQNKIQQLKAQIAHRNREYESIEDKYEAKVHEYDALKRKHDKELEIQMEHATPAPDEEAVPAFYAPFLRSLSHQDVQAMSRNVSDPKLQFAMIHGVDSMTLLPDVDETYPLVDGHGFHCITHESEEDSDLDSEHVVPIPYYMQEAMEKEKEKEKEKENLEKDTQVFIVNMMNTVHQKDTQIEQLSAENQRLNKFIVKLKKENRNLLNKSKRNERPRCAGRCAPFFGWGR
eukprot:490424_1